MISDIKKKMHSFSPAEYRLAGTETTSTLLQTVSRSQELKYLTISRGMFVQTSPSFRQES